MGKGNKARKALKDQEKRNRKQAKQSKLKSDDSWEKKKRKKHENAVQDNQASFSVSVENWNHFSQLTDKKIEFTYQPERVSAQYSVSSKDVELSCEGVTIVVSVDDFDSFNPENFLNKVSTQKNGRRILTSALSDAVEQCDASASLNPHSVVCNVSPKGYTDRLTIPYEIIGATLTFFPGVERLKKTYIPYEGGFGASELGVNISATKMGLLSVLKEIIAVEYDKLVDTRYHTRR